MTPSSRTPPQHVLPSPPPPPHGHKVQQKKRPKWKLAKAGRALPPDPLHRTRKISLSFFFFPLPLPCSFFSLWGSSRGILKRNKDTDRTQRSPLRDKPEWLEEFTDNSTDEDVSASSDAPESVSREPLHQNSDTSGIGQARHFFAHFPKDRKSASGPTKSAERITRRMKGLACYRGSVTNPRGRHNLRSLAAHTSPRRSAKLGTATRDGEHPRPLKGGWGVPCSCCSQVFKLNCFWAPSSPSLHGHNHKTAPVT